MVVWSDFERQAPAMATAGRKLLYQFGIGLGFLATIRADGGPRLHPICPVLLDGHLYGLIGPSPKRRDLLRDGRYALHSFPSPDRDDEFYLTGRGQARQDAQLTAAVRTAFLATGGTSSNDELLFELLVEHALLATYKPRGQPNNWPPLYTKWHAPGSRD